MYTDIFSSTNIFNVYRYIFIDQYFATTYEKARKIIANKNIKSKESYYELCERDNRLPKEPEIVFKRQFNNWIEYLSIERVYYDLETCKKKVWEYLVLYEEIKKHYLDLSIVSNELCKIDVLFPPNGLWIEYYNTSDCRRRPSHRQPPGLTLLDRDF